MHRSAVGSDEFRRRLTRVSCRDDTPGRTAMNKVSRVVTEYAGLVGIPIVGVLVALQFGAWLQAPAATGHGRVARGRGERRGQPPIAPVLGGGPGRLRPGGGYRGPLDRPTASGRRDGDGHRPRPVAARLAGAGGLAGRVSARQPRAPEYPQPARPAAVHVPGRARVRPQAPATPRAHRGAGQPREHHAADAARRRCWRCTSTRGSPRPTCASTSSPCSWARR